MTRWNGCGISYTLYRHIAFTQPGQVRLRSLTCVQVVLGTFGDQLLQGAYLCLLLVKQRGELGQQVVFDLLARRHRFLRNPAQLIALCRRLDILHVNGAMEQQDNLSSS